MLVAISQRRSNGADTLETTYGEYFEQFGIDLLPIANRPAAVTDLNKVEIDGVILSGGGDVYPSYYGGRINPAGDYSPDRDETERQLVSRAMAQQLPILGICRGMQSLNVMFGGRIADLETEVDSPLRHVRTKHVISVNNESIQQALGSDSTVTNSFHNLGIRVTDLSPALRPFATASDSTIEGLYSPGRALAAIMWHPEREEVITPLNRLLTEAFKEGEFFWERKQ